jgi:putative protease
MLRDKLGRLGGTPLKLRSFHANIRGGPMVPVSMLNRVRRDLVASVLAQLDETPRRVVREQAGRQLIQSLASTSPLESPSPRLAVLCRTLEQLETACRSDVGMVYADFHDIRQYRDAVRIARQHDTRIGLASVRMQKPGEMGLCRVLGRHEPDCILARNLAAIDHFRETGIRAIADFSLNVANHRSAEWLRGLGVDRVTASYDLNRDQLLDLVKSLPADWMEIVVHQHMPMFHMEHCVFCAVLSAGTNKTNCGRPCDRHVVQLRDRVGAEHTLQADVACRNTLFNATAQSGAEIVDALLEQGVKWFRIELLEEDAAETEQTTAIYRGLLGGELSGRAVWQKLRATNRLGVTRGTLESKRNPLAIL